LKALREFELKQLQQQKGDDDSFDYSEDESGDEYVMKLSKVPISEP